MSLSESNLPSCQGIKHQILAQKRTLDHRTSEIIRIMAVRRVQEGEASSVVMKNYGLCRTSIYRWLRAAKVGGEAALRSRKHPGPTPKLTDKEKQQVRTWGAKGQTPVVKTSGQRQSVSAISAVTARGAFWYSVYTGRLNATRFVEFLKAFMRNRRRPVFLVIDGLPAHKARLVAAYVQSLEGALELHFLPGYSPDLNPDEFVWNHLRYHGTTKTPLRKNESLRNRVEQNLADIQCSPKLVRSFFRASSVAYTMH